MKAIIYFSLSNRTKLIAESIEGDKYRIEPFGKVPKTLLAQLIILGFAGVRKKSKPIKPLNIDLEKYDEIVLATPVYAGRVACFMRAFLEENDILGKKITLIATADGSEGKTMKDFKSYLEGNDFEELVYIKGELQ